MQRLMAVLFVLALALRIAVPAGFMPVQSANGFVISICDGLGGSKSMVLDVHRDDAGSSHDDRAPDASPCAFAALAVLALAALPVAMLAAPALLLCEFALPPPPAVTLRRIAFLIPPLRGPPASA